MWNPWIRSILGLGRQLPVLRFLRSLSSLTPHPLLAGVAPSCLPVPPSPSFPPCSTQRSIAAAWGGTLRLGEWGAQETAGMESGGASSVPGSGEGDQVFESGQMGLSQSGSVWEAGRE